MLGHLLQSVVPNRGLPVRLHDGVALRASGRLPCVDCPVPKVCINSLQIPPQVLPVIGIALAWSSWRSNLANPYRRNVSLQQIAPIVTHCFTEGSICLLLEATCPGSPS